MSAAPLTRHSGHSAGTAGTWPGNVARIAGQHHQWDGRF
jgi:hypothetical protein